MDPAPPTSSPGPLGRYLLHPGQDTSVVVHRVLHLLVHFGHFAAPIVAVTTALAVFAWLALLLARRQRSVGEAQLVAVAPGPEVDPAGAEVLWNALHGILRRTKWAALAGRPHVSFELSWLAGRLRIGIWVPPRGVSRPCCPCGRGGVARRGYRHPSDIATAASPRWDWWLASFAWLSPNGSRFGAIFRLILCGCSLVPQGGSIRVTPRWCRSSHAPPPAANTVAVARPPSRCAPADRCRGSSGSSTSG